MEASSAEDAEAIVLNEPWLFRQWRYIDDLIADPVVGRFPYKTYTINSDDAGTGLLRGVYCCLSARRFDARLHAAAPFLSRHNQMVIQRAGKVRGTPSYLATFKGNTKSNRRLRGELIEVCDRSKSLHGETSDKWLNHSDDEKTLFIDLLQSGKFSLCPAGWGAATFRILRAWPWASRR